MFWYEYTGFMASAHPPGKGKWTGQGLLLHVDFKVTLRYIETLGKVLCTLSFKSGGGVT